MDLGPWLVTRDVTVVSTVPALASLWPAEALEAVRLLIFGGEACPPELVERLAVEGREVWNTYGPTEATVVACAAILTGGAPISIGVPLPGWDLAVVDADGQPVGYGEVGELVIGGVGLARYLDEDKDAEKYAPMATLGWERAYRSGDLVRMERDGLFFCGRSDDQVKVGGAESSWARSTPRWCICRASAAARPRYATPPPELRCWLAIWSAPIRPSTSRRRASCSPSSYPPRWYPAWSRSTSCPPARRQGRPGRAAVATAGWPEQLRRGGDR